MMASRPFNVVRVGAGARGLPASTPSFVATFCQDAEPALGTTSAVAIPCAST